MLFISLTYFLCLWIRSDLFFNFFIDRFIIPNVCRFGVSSTSRMSPPLFWHHYVITYLFLLSVFILLISFTRFGKYYESAKCIRLRWTEHAKSFYFIKKKKLEMKFME